MTTELDQVRSLLASFRRSEAELNASLKKFEQIRKQTTPIPEQIGNDLASRKAFLIQYGIDVPKISSVTPTPAPEGVSKLAVLRQRATATARALAELDQLQRDLPTLVNVPAGEVKRSRSRLFTVDIETQHLPQFWISVTPVTNQQYSVFLEAQAGQTASSVGGTPIGWPGGRYPTGAARRPVTGVTYERACDYCRWAGLQLPDESQWLRAARGDSLGDYPWGNGNPGEAINDPARDVGAVSGDRSPFGVHDMLGLTAQWLATPQARTPRCTGAGSTLGEITSFGAGQVGIRVVRNTGAPLSQPHRSTARHIRWFPALVAALAAAYLSMFAWTYGLELVQQVTEQLEQAQMSTISTATAIEMYTAFAIAAERRTVIAAEQAATATVIAAEQAATAAAIAAEQTATAAEVAPTRTAIAATRAQLIWITVPAGGGVESFRISRTEVTNSQYAQCVAAGACSEPSNTTRYGNPARVDHPVVWVTPAQAREYAAWIGGSLPTEAQWVRACQGDDGRAYPWGNQPPDATQANYANNGVGDTMPVGEYPAGASPYGALDMAGNVYEWVAAGDDSDASIVRGGSFSSNASLVMCDERGELGAETAFVGFRVVSPEP